jgi:hypothetical protein
MSAFHFSGLALAAISLACASDTGIVPLGPHRPELEPKPIRVRSPSPPVEIAVLPLRRNEECFYLDGHYAPQGSSWRWVTGEWILPPADCYYAPPTTQYEKLEVGTTLVFRKGAWHPQNEENNKCGPALACPAANID